MNLKDLSKPFPESDWEWRVQQSGKKGEQIWALVVPYVSARAIQDRLDAVCGPENWQNLYSPGPAGGVLCGIAIRIGEEWVTKWDGCENTAIEPVKGGLSGSLKRAAVHWGIGRHLYSLEGPFFAKVHEAGKHRDKVENKYWFRWDPPRVNSCGYPSPPPKPPQDSNPATNLQGKSPRRPTAWEKMKRAFELALKHPAVAADESAYTYAKAALTIENQYSDDGRERILHRCAELIRASSEWDIALEKAFADVGFPLVEEEL